MTDHTKDPVFSPPTRAEIKRELSLLDKLIEDSRCYKKGRDYKELLDFVAKLPNMAPFNAMLIQLQKPGIAYAASAAEWRRRFRRTLKEGARPLLILMPFSPVGLVYDLQETEGEPVPKDAFSFTARGNIKNQDLNLFRERLMKKNIEVFEYDAGDQNAGYIRVVSRAANEKEYSAFKMGINKNSDPPAQFATIAHELGHLFLGHLGREWKHGIAARPKPSHAMMELEAESVAYIVCMRRGVEPESKHYLTEFVEEQTTVEHLGVDRIFRAAGHVESILGLDVRTVPPPAPDLLFGRDRIPNAEMEN